MGSFMKPLEAVGTKRSPSKQPNTAAPAAAVVARLARGQAPEGERLVRALQAQVPADEAEPEVPSRRLRAGRRLRRQRHPAGADREGPASHCTASGARAAARARAMR